MWHVWRPPPKGLCAGVMGYIFRSPLHAHGIRVGKPLSLGPVAPRQQGEVFLE